MDLAWYNSLRTLKIHAKSLPTDPEGTYHLTISLSLIISPPFELVITYTQGDFYPSCAQQWPGHVGYVGELKGIGAKSCEACDKQKHLFDVLDKIHRERNFRLVFCAEVWRPDPRREKVEFITMVLKLHMEAHQRRQPCSQLLSNSSFTWSMRWLLY